MNNPYRGWYYCAECGHFGGFRFIEDTPYGNHPDAWTGNIYGPFKTFGEAKRDAEEYFRTDIHIAREALKEVKDIRFKDLPKQYLK